MASSLKKAMKNYDLSNACGILAGEIDNSPAIDRVMARWSGYNGNEYKYLDYIQWLTKATYMARSMLLDRRANLKFLDIGSGPGWLSWIAARLGHKPLGIDSPDAPEVYGDLCNALNVPVMPHLIQPGKRLPLKEKYDVAAALMASFYLYDPRWDADAFDFFLTDLESHMNDRHIILLELNFCSGQCFTPAIYEQFIKHDYTITDNFCFRVKGHKPVAADFIFNSLSRYHRMRNKPYEPIWHYAVPRCVIKYPGMFIDNLREDFPKDASLIAHKALFLAINKNYARSLALMEKAAEMCPECAGYAVALAQIRLLRGERAEAIKAIKRHLEHVPQSRVGQEWLALLAIDPEQPVSDASAFWKQQYAAISGSKIFQEMLDDSPELTAISDPVSWYLRHGVMGSGFIKAFTPASYWGLNDNIFRSGADPLIHYIVDTGETGRRY